MIIGIDGNEANIERRVGVNEYAFQLLCSLWKLQGELHGKHRLIVYLKEKPLPDMPEETANFKYKILSGGGLWVLTKLMPVAIFNPDKLNVLFSPSHYIPPFSSVPRVFSIMDLGYLETSEQFTKIVFWQLKYWSAISIFVSKAIIAISIATKTDIVRHYPSASGKIYVTYLGYDKSRFNNSISEKDVRRVKNKYAIVDDYVLFIGTLKPSKNIEGLIEAFKIVNSKFPKIRLVVSGKKGWLYKSIFEKAEKLGLNKEIVYTDFINEEDKPGLIKGAKAFVLPSLWEGFGLDPLYAMAVGVPVVVSDVGSLKEVTGDAAVLVNPRTPESIAEGIIKVLSMSKTDYNITIERGFAQAGKFSWEKCARETLKILENVYGQNR